MPLAKISTFAEYAAVDSEAITHIFEYLSDEAAAGVPPTAPAALQAYELMDLTKGSTLFISSGTGSVGATAIPIAKSMGAVVYTTDCLENASLQRYFNYDEYNSTDALL